MSQKDLFNLVFQETKDDFDIAFNTAAFVSSRNSKVLKDRYFGLQQLQGLFWKFKWELSVLRHFYRQDLINNAIEWGNKISSDFKPVTVRIIGTAPPFSESFFTSCYYDMILSGYTAMYHKIEALSVMLQKHAKGEALGPLASNEDFVNYTYILNSEGIDFNDFGEINKKNGYFHPRINLIRLINNRSKHDAGYPKDSKDTILQLLPKLALTDKVIPSIDIFYDDFLYVQEYISTISALISRAYILAVIRKEIEDTQNEILPLIGEKTKEQYLIELESHFLSEEITFKSLASRFKGGGLFKRTIK